MRESPFRFCNGFVSLIFTLNKMCSVYLKKSYVNIFLKQKVCNMYRTSHTLIFIPIYIIRCICILAQNKLVQ